MNSKEFSLKIEDIVREKRISYMDAVIWYCDNNDIDTSTVAPMINKSLKEKIKIEAQEKNMVKFPKTGKLPL
jgi:hypothetical protein